MTPQEIVSELDRHIVGQAGAKRAVAIALRNRWRRQQVDETLRDEITPKNILMIGPTGVGKTEIARRLAKLADAPFIKVEATKFTEVGYVGKDVDSIVRDLVDMAVKQERESGDAQASARAPRTPPRSASSTCWCRRRARDFGLAPAPTADNTARQVLRKRLREGALDDKEIEIERGRAEAGAGDHGPGRHGGDDRAAAGHVRQPRRRASARRASCKIAEALKLLIDEEAAKLVNDDEIKTQRARQRRAERHRLHRRDRQGRLALARAQGADVSRQGVQRDLLPLVEGTTVNTKYGMVKTDHILFIASGAFHLSQAERPDPRAAGALPDPRRARLAVGRRLRGAS